MKKFEVMEVKVEDLNAFGEDIFPLYEGDRLDEMVASIQENGVIHPIVCRETDDGLTILSGHNRVNAGMIAGLVTVPVINRGRLSDDEARLIVTESNLMQRGFDELTLVEKARCIAVRYAAMKRQGFRTDLVGEVEEYLTMKGRARERLAKSFNMSGATVGRYVQIDGLTKEIKLLIDADKLNFYAAVYVTSLTEEHQWMLSEIMVELDENLTEGKANELNTLEKADYLTRDAIYAVFNREKDFVKDGFRLNGNFLGEHFPDGTSKEEMLERIREGLKLLEEMGR